MHSFTGTGTLTFNSSILLTDRLKGVPCFTGSSLVLVLLSCHHNDIYEITVPFVLIGTLACYITAKR